LPVVRAIIASGITGNCQLPINYCQLTALQLLIVNGQLAIARWSLPVAGGQSSIHNHQR
jgi:hypothetical protein